jgi:hypothetical protein
MDIKNRLLDFIYASPFVSLLWVSALSLIFLGIAYETYLYEYVMNSGHFGVPSTNLLNEGPIGYSLLITLGVCGFFWVKKFLTFTKEVQGYHSLIASGERW